MRDVFSGPLAYADGPCANGVKECFYVSDVCINENVYATYACYIVKSNTLYFCYNVIRTMCTCCC
jgi:hypothetical protein